MADLPRTLKVRVSREFLEDYFTRDVCGNRLSIDVGEPDDEGFYTPVITVHYDDNLLASNDLRRLRRPWL